MDNLRNTKRTRVYREQSTQEARPLPSAGPQLRGALRGDCLVRVPASSMEGYTEEFTAGCAEREEAGSLGARL